MSAAIVKNYWINTGNWAGDSLDFIGLNHGDSIPDLSFYDKIIMCDISFPANVMVDLRNKLIWIDHHISAINSVTEYADEYSYIDSYKDPEIILIISYLELEIQLLQHVNLPGSTSFLMKLYLR